MQRLVISCLLFLLAPALSAVELPAPAALLKQPGVSAQSVKVVEPHESHPSQTTDVTYRAVPAIQVLDHLLGRGWRSADNDVVFLATDKYQFAGSIDEFERYKAYFAFARADGKPFTVEIEKGKPIALGPYYLIWDNINAPALIKRDGYAWPFQVTRVELRPKSDYDRLLPANPSRPVRDGFALVKQYCLTCHQIANIGGRKKDTDLRQSVCPLRDSQLKALINNPSDASRAAGMPALNEWLQGEERKRTIDLIVAYFRAMPPEGQSCQLGSGRPSIEK
jgi:mono/diheme cytochrome c family protein